MILIDQLKILIRELKYNKTEIIPPEETFEVKKKISDDVMIFEVSKCSPEMTEQEAKDIIDRLKFEGFKNIGIEQKGNTTCIVARPIVKYSS